MALKVWQFLYQNVFRNMNNKHFDAVCNT